MTKLERRMEGADSTLALGVHRRAGRHERPEGLVARLLVRARDGKRGEPLPANRVDVVAGTRSEEEADPLGLVRRRELARKEQRRQMILVRSPIDSADGSRL